MGILGLGIKFDCSAKLFFRNFVPTFFRESAGEIVVNLRIRIIERLGYIQGVTRQYLTQLSR